MQNAALANLKNIYQETQDKFLLMAVLSPT
jgi:hypothetical protein